MSFILDALRKSEHERQRGAVPGIAHVPFATPRAHVPRWVFAVIAVLAAAVLALGGAWWRSTALPERPPVAATPPTAEPARTLDLPPLAPAPRRAAAGSDSLSAAVPPPPSADAPPSGGTASPPASVPAPRASVSVSMAPSGQPAEPAVPPVQRPPAPAAADPTLPSAASLAAEGVVVPRLRLELHAFAEQPAQRFVFINGRRYGEGETLAEGPRLVSIEPRGAVLVHDGRRFLLAPE